MMHWSPRMPVETGTEYQLVFASVAIVRKRDEIPRIRKAQIQLRRQFPNGTEVEAGIVTFRHTIDARIVNDTCAVRNGQEVVDLPPVADTSVKIRSERRGVRGYP